MTMQPVGSHAPAQVQAPFEMECLIDSVTLEPLTHAMSGRCRHSLNESTWRRIAAERERKHHERAMQKAERTVEKLTAANEVLTGTNSEIARTVQSLRQEVASVRASVRIASDPAAEFRESYRSLSAWEKFLFLFRGPATTTTRY